jgi:hypothetical protein
MLPPAASRCGGCLASETTWTDVFFMAAPVLVWLKSCAA